MRPRRLVGASGRPLNFTVRRLVVRTYDVIVQGQGISVPVGDGVAVGFFHVVRVSARDPVQAQQSALGLTKSDWNSSPNARLNRGDEPRLTIDSVAELPWWQSLLSAKEGLRFLPSGTGF
jgi:hypothetical protein